MHLQIIQSEPAEETIHNGDRIERKWVRATADNGFYRIDAVLFRRHKVGQMGYIGCTAWQFGTFGTFKILPEADQGITREILADIELQVNSNS